VIFPVADTWLKFKLNALISSSNDKMTEKSKNDRKVTRYPPFFGKSSRSVFVKLSSLISG